MGKKYVDLKWDFISANTKEYTHCYNTYPAMMIPQVAREIINKYKSSSMKLLFDPYCGSGTSLVEANLAGLNAIGTDLNPLARLITKAKTTKIDLSVLDREIEKFTIEILREESNRLKKNVKYPIFDNMEYWFKEENVKELAIILNYIKNIQNEEIKLFFLVAFSETVRYVSLTRNGEFKLYRIDKDKIALHNECAFTIIEERLIRNRNGLEDYIKTIENDCFSIIKDFNTIEPILEIEKESIDIIVTSPPYGDSKTTVAYGQFSRLANQWLEVENANNIDNILMGGKKRKIEKFQYELLDSTISKIADEDVKRAEEVFSFYYDYRHSINNISKVVKKDGIVAYVVGNRTVKNQVLQTDEFTRYFFEQNGFEHVETIIRNIPNKRMPKRNSPSNEKGKTVSTMNNEFIVIMRKVIKDE